MSETAVDGPQDAAAGFAALMNKAAEQAGGPAGEAPFGWTTDADGTRRPKKTAGRPRKSPALEELKTQKDQETAAAGPDKPGDRAPSARRIRRSKGAGAGDKPAAPVPQFREGVIAKGINRLYRRGGKLVRVMDADVGQALIDITKKDDEDDVTVGEAWEELARTNPRIRAFLMKIIAGGAVGQLFACHAPVLLAILMKDAIRRRLPFMKLMEAFLTPDTEDGGDGTAPADGTPLEGLQMPDMEQMMAMARQFAEQAMGGRATAGTPRQPGPDVASGAAAPPHRGPAAIAAGPAANGS